MTKGGCFLLLLVTAGATCDHGEECTADSKAKDNVLLQTRGALKTQDLEMAVGGDGDAGYCAAQCQEAGYCCNDWTRGSNQMISCAQACMMRAGGSRTSEMLAANDGICNRNGQSGCSLNVNGQSYGFCSSCQDLTGAPQCSWGVASSAACDFGAGLSPPGAPDEVAGPQLLGCFIDDGNRAFEGGSVRLGKNSDTVSNCAARCSGRAYMAVQDGDECFCGDSYETGSPYVQVADSQCSKNGACEVQSGCGEAWKNSIYRISGDEGLCTNSCNYASDDDCDDGGANSDYSLCDIGTDCTDCGGRSGGCTNTCNYVSDDDCDDGGANSDYSLCDFGTDCTDCGDRSSAMLLQQKDSKKVKNEAAAKAKKVAAEAKELVREKAISEKKAKKASAKAKKAAAGSGGGSGSGAGVQA